nr:hypothetical protein [Sneathiella glossodoripedis]
MIEKYGTIADTFAAARKYGTAAKEALGIFEDSPVKSALLSAVDFAIDRAY